MGWQHSKLCARLRSLVFGDHRGLPDESVLALDQIGERMTDTRLERVDGWDWVRDHGYREFGDLLAAAESLDAKAASVIGHAGIIASLGVFALAHIAATKAYAVGLALLPFLALLLYAVHRANAVREPMEQPTLPTTGSVIEWAQGDIGTAQHRLALALWAAAESMAPIVERKQRLLTAATEALTLAVLALVVPIGIVLGIAVARAGCASD